jgi:hypothetical protein
MFLHFCPACRVVAGEGQTLQPDAYLETFVTIALLVHHTGTVAFFNQAGE